MNKTSPSPIFALVTRPIVLGPLSLAIVGGSLIYNARPVVGDAPIVVDISDIKLTNRSANCADYANNYAAKARDIGRGITFDAKVRVGADESSCTIESNAIPNHDFNATGRFAHVVSEQTQTYRIPAKSTNRRQTDAAESARR